MDYQKNKNSLLKLAIIWLAIIMLGGFWLTTLQASAPVSIAVVPQAPKEGEPVVATFKINNPSADTVVTSYQMYANGILLDEGVTSIPPQAGKTYKYAYPDPLKMGEQLNFAIKTQSELGNYERVLSSPPYPPQIWSSFVSFATFSTSLMSSITTMTYYQSVFGTRMGLNVGLISTVVLVILLIFMELSRPAVEGGMVARLGRMRVRYSTVVWILFIIFTFIVYTKVALMIIG